MDREPLLSISEDETVALSDVERAAGHFAQPLRGPSLDNLDDLGINTRELEDSGQTAFGGISFRDEHSLNTNHRLDDFKEHDAQMESAQEIEYTYQKVIASTSSTMDPSLHHAEDGGISTYSSNINEDEAPSDQSLNSDMSSWTNMPVKPNTGIAPLLSEGKKYHVFFSYEIADRDWVEEVTRKLESPELGFKCSIHERDFHAGKRIIENITEHIRISEKTVLVLSPDFIQSHWCMFEVELGMVLSMEESQLLVVPVMVRQCDVPDGIKTLTYIDAMQGDDWWQRFMDAITTQDGLLTNFSGTKDLTIQPRYANMDHLTDLSSSFKCLSGEAIRTPYIPDVLMRSGIQMSVVDFDHAMDIIRTASRCFCKSFFDVAGCCVPLLVLLILAGFIAMPLVFFYYLQPGSVVHVDNGLKEKLAGIFILLFSPWIVLVILFFVQKYLRKSRLQKAVNEANRIFMKRNVITGFTVESYITILFRIKRQLTTFLKASGRFSSYDDFQDLSQTRAAMLINRHSGEYTSAYIAGNLRPKEGTRHVRNASCLCQFIEEKYADGQNIPDFDLGPVSPIDRNVTMP